MPTQTEKQSALRPILEKVYTSPDRETALKILTDYLATPDCVIRPDQRRTMLLYANRCETLLSLQQYVTNSFLYYELGSVNRFVRRGR